MTRQYRVRSLDAAGGRVVEETVEAATDTAARALILARQGVPLSVELIGVSAGWVPGRRAPAALPIAWWCRELRTLLRAGMTVVEAIETLQDQSAQGARRTSQAALLRSLREGLPLSRAMQQAGGFPQVLVASVKASERTSALVSALDDYLRYDELVERLRRQAISASIYPAVVMGLGMLIALFLLVYVVPRFSRIYTDFQGEPSGATAVLLKFSALLNDHAGVLALTAMAIGAALVWLARRGVLLKAGGVLIQRLQPLQRQWDHFRLAKLYQSLAMMFKGGYSLDEALQVCEGLRLGHRLDTALGQARSDIRRGRGVSRAFSEAGLCDAVAQRLLAAGERSGSFAEVLQTVADRHAQAFATFIERATRIVEPLLLLVVALVVGAIIVLMYMPIFDIANSVG